MALMAASWSVLGASNVEVAVAHLPQLGVIDVDTLQVLWKTSNWGTSLKWAPTKWPAFALLTRTYQNNRYFLQFCLPAIMTGGLYTLNCCGC